MPSNGVDILPYFADQRSLGFRIAFGNIRRRQRDKLRSFDQLVQKLLCQLAACHNILIILLVSKLDISYGLLCRRRDYTLVASLVVNPLKLVCQFFFAHCIVISGKQEILQESFHAVAYFRFTPYIPIRDIVHAQAGNLILCLFQHGIPGAERLSGFDERLPSDCIYGPRYSAKSGRNKAADIIGSDFFTEDQNALPSVSSVFQAVQQAAYAVQHRQVEYRFRDVQQRFNECAEVGVFVFICEVLP